MLEWEADAPPAIDFVSHFRIASWVSFKDESLISGMANLIAIPDSCWNGTHKSVMSIFQS